MRHQTLLLSAFACAPGRGSEPGIGWNWAIELAGHGHDVWVLTQPEHAPAISRAMAESPNERLRFVYVDVPLLCHWDRLPGLLKEAGYLLHVYAWQWFAYFRARALTRRVRFDLVHHVTMGSIRVPSLLGSLGLPFVYGPVAGGDCPPRSLRKGLPAKARRYERLRELSNLWVHLDPMLLQTFGRASVILATTHQTRAVLPRRYRAKALVQLAIGSPPVPPCIPAPRRAGEFRLMFAGRLLGWKGLHLGLKAFHALRHEVPGARLTVIGSGPDEAWLKELASELKLEAAIEWIPWLPRDEVLQAYARHDAFLFPSLRDSGGMVVLEALGCGLPVVCLDLGGPGVIVDEHCGRVIPTGHRPEAEVVAGLHAALRELADDPALVVRLAEGARARAARFAWPDVVQEAYAALEPLLAEPAARLQADGLVREPGS